MGLAKLVTPETSANRDDAHLGVDDSAADGSSNFGRALPAEADVAVFVADDNESLEASALT